jgi:hypothetical protein
MRRGKLPALTAGTAISTFKQHKGDLPFAAGITYEFLPRFDMLETKQPSRDDLN